MASIYLENLSKDVRRKLKNAEYTPNEVARIHHAVKQRHLEKQKGLKRAMIAVVLGVVLIIGMTVMGGRAMPVEMILFMAKAFGSVLLVVFALVWYLANKMTLQFLSALNRGYPELAEKYGKHTFNTVS